MYFSRSHSFGCRSLALWTQHRAKLLGPLIDASTDWRIARGAIEHAFLERLSPCTRFLAFPQKCLCERNCVGLAFRALVAERPGVSLPWLAVVTFRAEALVHALGYFQGERGKGLRVSTTCEVREAWKPPFREPWKHICFSNCG